MADGLFREQKLSKTAQLLTFYFLPLLLSIGFGGGTIELW